MTDEALIALLRENPERGFPVLIRQYGGYVYTIVRNRLRDCAAPEDIEETVSDVFVQLWEWMQAHPKKALHLRAMLAVIAKRRSISRFRALTGQPACEPLDALLTEPQDNAPAPDESVQLIESVRALGEPESEIILRRYYFGQSSREIGDALGLLPNTVDQKLSRALKRLRAIWKEEPNVYE